MKITVPEVSLVVLAGPSGAGKSSFARRHFKPTEVLSSDAFRALVSDDENSEEATPDAFEALAFVAGKRLAAGKLTVVDATNTRPEERRPLVEVARRHHCSPVIIVLDVPERVCRERNAARADRAAGAFGPHVVRDQIGQLHRALGGLQKEGFRHVTVLSSVAEIEAATVERRRLSCNRSDERGPFDIVGDVHGCADELRALLGALGYREEGGAYRHPEGRRLVFLGDLVDRGPKVPEVLRLAMAMVEAGSALAVPGNHDVKLMRKLRGRDVKIGHGLAESLAQLEAEPPEFKERVAQFVDSLVSHYVLDEGRLVVAHAGMKAALQGRGSAEVRAFALYGDSTGEMDEYGMPVRLDWVSDYRGRAAVVYGHTPVVEAEWINNTTCVDTGCVFGGKLTALRWPERDWRSVPAAHVYWAPTKPLAPPRGSAPPPEAPRARTEHQEGDDVLGLDDVSGKRVVATRLLGNVTVREEQGAAALEAMSRFAVDPRWLIHLPPTMSPPETSRLPGLLEHPAEAFGYYARQGVTRVVCEEKHMGSRAIVVLCRDEGAARARFGVTSGEAGMCFARTGRRFFTDPALEAAILDRLRAAATTAGLWEALATDWLCLDCEVMPWSLKSQALIHDQYAAVGTAARAALGESVRALAEASAAGCDVGDLLERHRERLALSEKYTRAWRRHVWPVTGVESVRLAPFHLLASEGACHADQPHPWHLERLAALAAADPELIVATAHRLVALDDAASVAAGVAWWQELTEAGGEGMVVKPLDFTARGAKGLLQPAIKCRGREHLRIVYGPDYTLDANLERLRDRGLGAKRGLALREFALGVEALERFVARRPLRAVHECVFGVLAMESEAVDPRL